MREKYSELVSGREEDRGREAGYEGDREKGRENDRLMNEIVEWKEKERGWREKEMALEKETGALRVEVESSRDGV